MGPGAFMDRDIYAFDFEGDVEMYAWVLPDEFRLLSSDRGRDTLCEWLSNLKPNPREVACCRDARGGSNDSLSVTSCEISRPGAGGPAELVERTSR